MEIPKIETEPKNLFQELREKNPDCNILVPAFDKFKTQEEINEFFNGYKKWLEESGIKNPDKTAESNVAFMLSLGYSQDTKDLWKDVMPHYYNPPRSE